MDKGQSSYTSSKRNDVAALTRPSCSGDLRRSSQACSRRRVWRGRIRVTAAANGSQMQLAELADLARDEVTGSAWTTPTCAPWRRAESIDVRDEDVEGVSRSVRGVGVRVLAGGAWGFAATNDPAQVRALGGARARHRPRRATVAAPAVRLDDTPPPSGTYTTPHERNPFDVPLAEKIDLLRATTAAAARPRASRTSRRRPTRGSARRCSARPTAAGSTRPSCRSAAGCAAPRSARASCSAGRTRTRSAASSPAAAGRTCSRSTWRGTRDRRAPRPSRCSPRPSCRRTTPRCSSSRASSRCRCTSRSGTRPSWTASYGMERAFAGTSSGLPGDRGTLRYGSPIVTIPPTPRRPARWGRSASTTRACPRGGADHRGGRARRVPDQPRDRGAARRAEQRHRARRLVEHHPADPDEQRLAAAAASRLLDDLVADTDDGVLLPPTSRGRSTTGG